MDKVALFGASFNPIARHHERIGHTVWAEMAMKTFFMPCFRHRYAKNSDLIDASHRWNMVMEVTNDPANQDIMTAFDFEIARQHDGSMFETMSSLKDCNPNIEFHIVVGMDNANEIETKWHNGSQLIQMCPFIVVECAGVTPTTDWFSYAPHRVLPFHSTVHSKQIRTAIQEGRHEFARQNLHPRVWDYITMGHLYGYGG